MTVAGYSAVSVAALSAMYSIAAFQCTSTKDGNAIEFLFRVESLRDNHFPNQLSTIETILE
jgi:hypothetical protein